MAGMFLSQRFMHEARIIEGYMNKRTESGHYVMAKCGCTRDCVMPVLSTAERPYNFDYYENYRYQKWLKEHSKG